MSDVFNVTASYDKGSYTQGQTITATIAGGAVLTTTQISQVGPITLPIVAADGAISTVAIGTVPATMTVTTPESVVIDTSRPIVDSSPTPRTWTVSANKLSITATA